MVFLTGDTHGYIDSQKLFDFAKIHKNLTKNDYMIILGDFGFIFYPNPDNAKEKYQLKELSELPYTILFIDGNHCNFDRLNSYPVETWNGGKIHRISDSIFHLMRGQVFNIQNKTFFTMGGAQSYDKAYRTEGFDWWKEEVPSYQEVNEMIDNANKVKNVDCVLTHTCTTNMIPYLIEYSDMNDPTNSILDGLDKILTYKHWYFGHWHKDIINIDKKHTCLYNKIIQLI